MDKEVKRSLIEWHPVSARIIVASFKTTVRNIVMIQCYAPTAVAEDAERQQFCVQLNDILKKKKKKDIIIVGGDLNAKVGQDNEGLEHVMGRHGLGERDENGQLFVDFCASHDLVIGGTIFPPKDCHELTWVSPDHKTNGPCGHWTKMEAIAFRRNCSPEFSFIMTKTPPVLCYTQRNISSFIFERLANLVFKDADIIRKPVTTLK